MERREDEQPLTRNWNTMTRAEQIAARHEIYDRSGIPNDEYTASWWDVKELLNQHTALVAQRDLLVAALREVRAKFFEHAQAGANVVKGNLVPLDNEQHPWIPGVEAPSTIQVIDNALATVEQGKGRESGE